MSLIRRIIVALLPVAAIAVVITAVVLLGGCGRSPSPAAEATATEPTRAVQQLIDDLHRNDLAGYARHALPPALHARMAAAWTEGRTIWPLTELPLDDRLPALITTLAAPGSEKALLAAYNRQFAGADSELRSAAATLGLFAAQYVSGAEEYSRAEREHYTQLIAALSQWGRRAPLGDPAKARVAVPQLVAAARLTGLAGGLDTFHATGMERSLARLGPFFARFKQVLRGYGLDLDQTLAGARVTLLEQTGDRARVTLDYTLDGQPVSAVMQLERHDGRWYLSDLLRHADAAAGPVAPDKADPAPALADPALTAN
jgi:hypothetical protein